MPITHAFVTGAPDDLIPDEVGPNDWNAAHVGSQKQLVVIPILTPSTKAEVTWLVDSLSYLDLHYLSFATDFDVIPWTHFRIFGYGRANATSQTITFQACHTGTSALSLTGNDASVGSTSAIIDSGWREITAILTGNQRLSVLMKGSTSTVDLTYQKLGIQLKHDS
jgi:hypothetical protein